MSHKFLFNASFYTVLMSIDRELAEKERRKGCCHCGGKLHQSHYPRSPLGVPIEFRFHFEERFSFCCFNCRKRSTPSSVRFFGRRWFPGPIFILISALMMGINERRLAQIKRHFGVVVSESTWKRWRYWWRKVFPTTEFWKSQAGLIHPDGIKGVFPRDLLTMYLGGLAEQMTLLLQFLSPMTAGFLQAV
jgi:hypothetical protein